MTHPSISLERKNYPFDNQRLEFLGDAVIQLVVTEHLYRLYPDFSEGMMTKLRTRIVSRAALKTRAQELDLGRYLMMGRGEEASGGRERASTLADAFESVVGAVYLDGGFDAARNFVLRATEDDFERIARDPEEVNPKGALQEILQAIEPCAPIYEVLEQSGPDHSKRFVARVIWNRAELGRGEGLSKKQAQVAAASDALTRKTWEGTRRRHPAGAVNMIYSLTLQTAGLVTGAVLLVAHFMALRHAGESRRWLKQFPRSRAMGTLLIALATIWSFLLIWGMDLGEFARLRNVMLGAIVAGAILAWIYVEEFLAVRAIGMLALLAAEPLLEAAFMRHETTRLLLVLLAYVWIINGLFWVGMPWLMRDQIAWLTAKTPRYRAAAWVGLLYSVALIVCAVFLWK